MPLANHAKLFRPLRGGIYIFAPKAGAPGTLGCIATSDGTDRWMVSCYHVLCRANIASTFSPGEKVCQPFADVVASVECGDASLDCAAARINLGIPTTGAILGLPALSMPMAPQVGMRVLKSGMETGITEAEIVNVDASGRVQLNLPSMFPRTAGGASGYEISAAGDSGAIWVEASSLAPVALHTGTLLAAGLGSGISLPLALSALGLSFVNV